MKEKIQSFFRTVQNKLYQKPERNPEKNLRFKISQGVLTDCRLMPHEREVTVPPGVHTIGSSAFYKWQNLERIILPDGVKTIRPSAFENCRKLKYVRLPESVVSIGASAFSGCESLEEIILPPKLTVLSRNLFKDCYSLKRICFPEQLAKLAWGVFMNCTSLEEVCLTIHTSVPDYAFQNCRSLKTVAIPYVSERIGVGAFQNCESLKNIVIPSRIRTITEFAFLNCTSLTGIQIPENVQFIGQEAFKNTGLEYVVIPSTLTEAGREVFANCEHLERVIFSRGIKEIYPGMFQDCISLKEIQLPDGVEIISRNAFSGCKSLTDITFPESLISVSYTAFTLCHNLWNLHWNGLDFLVKQFCDTENYSAPYEVLPNISTAFLSVMRSEVLRDEKVIAVYQYLFWQYLQFPEKQRLTEYIHENLEYMFRSLIAVKDRNLIQELLKQLELFTRQNVQEFIRCANEEQAYEIQVMLSEFQHTVFPPESIAETIKNKFEL